MKKKNTLGDVKIDKKLLDLYGSISNDVILFWTDYIPKFYIDCFGRNITNDHINFIVIDVYIKMIVNVLVDCKIKSQEIWKSESYVKFQWISPTYQFSILFISYVEMIKYDLKDPIFKEILMRKNTYEYRKYIISRIWTLPFDDMINFYLDEFSDDNYVKYFFDREKYWRQGDLKELEKKQKILMKKLYKNN
jgi:hypothetical protein